MSELLEATEEELKEAGKKAWDDGLRDIRISWGPEAYKLTESQRRRYIIDNVLNARLDKTNYISFSRFSDNPPKTHKEPKNILDYLADAEPVDMDEWDREDSE